MLLHFNDRSEITSIFKAYYEIAIIYYWYTFKANDLKN